ncbi:MAG: GNAT family N-acetyltransferase [Planctomycetota bacterium]
MNHDRKEGDRDARARSPGIFDVRRADCGNAQDAAAILALLDSYASDIRGGGRPLSPAVREQVIPAIKAHPTACVFLAWREGEAVGLAICFRGLSTFRAKPLLNVHDLAVTPAHRGQGIGRALLAAAESHAKAIGCCKLTLEVLQDNQAALGLYRRFGFGDFAAAENPQTTLFLEKEVADAD